MGQQERVLIGTSEGLHELGTLHRNHLAGSEVTALATMAGHWWADLPPESWAISDESPPGDNAARKDDPDGGSGSSRSRSSPCC
jgi:hypothetical protein